MLGDARDPAVLAQAQALTARAFAVDNKKDKTLDPTLSDAAVLVSSSNGDAALYDKVLAVSRNSGGSRGAGGRAEDVRAVSGPGTW